MELMKKLIYSFGASGYENRICDAIVDEIKDYVDDIKIDRLGNLIAKKNGNGKGKIMIAAHMDQSGVAATEIDDRGYIRFLKIGQFNLLNFLFSEVIFENGTLGVLSAAKSENHSELKEDDLFIDIGAANKKEAEAMIKAGSIGVFRQHFSFVKDRIFGGCIDSRVGCFISIEAIKRIKKSESDLYFVFSVQEETYRGGAVAAAYSVNPDCAIIIDSMASEDMPGASDFDIALGAGPAIKVLDRPLVFSRKIKAELEASAKKLGVCYQFDLSKKKQSSGSGILTTREGILTGGISIPVRYTGTPRQSADMKDIENGIKLISDFVENYY